MQHQHPTFEDIVTKRRPVEVIAEDDHHLAFLSPTPYRPGHVVVATKKVVPYLYDLSAEDHARLWSFVREVAVRQKERLGCERVCTGVIGWVVRHVHVHLVPTDADGQYPGLPGVVAEEGELRRIGELLRRK